MNRRTFTALLTIVLIALSSGSARILGGEQERKEVAVQGLRCEYLSNPLGIDVQKPRLSWMLNPAANVRGQSAYRVLVASAPEVLQQDRGDLWDSGRVASGQNTWIEYGGKNLVSGQQLYWKVRVWSDTGQALAVERSGDLVHGPPAPVGLAFEVDRTSRARRERPKARRFRFPWLRKTVALAQKPGRAVAYVNPLGYYELYINGRKVDDHVLSPAVSDYSKRNLYVTHEIADYLVPGKNVVALWLGRGWYVKGHPGVIHDGPLVRAQLDIITADGGTARGRDG